MQLTKSALLLALALVLSGCADDGGEAEESDSTDDITIDETAPEDEGAGEEGEDEGGVAEEETPEESAPPEPRGPVRWIIDIEGDDFIDGSLTVQAGDTVQWIHRDTAPHTVTAEDGSFDSGIMWRSWKGEYESVFDEVGEYPYYCELHSDMTDTITVLAVYEGTPEEA